MKFAVPLALLGLTLFVIAHVGCATSSPEPSPIGSAPPAAGSHNHGAHTGHSDMTHSGAEPSAMGKMKTELAKLSPKDSVSANRQHFCVVSGEMLGTMGAPKKVNVNGRQVWICCEGCRNSLLQKPDEYLAKLKQE